MNDDTLKYFPSKLKRSNDVFGEIYRSNYDNAANTASEEKQVYLFDSPEDWLKTTTADYLKLLDTSNPKSSQDYPSNSDKSGIVFILAVILIGLTAIFVLIFKHFDGASESTSSDPTRYEYERANSLTQDGVAGGHTTASYLDSPPPYSTQSSRTNSLYNLWEVNDHLNSEDMTSPPTYEEALKSNTTINVCNDR